MHVKTREASQNTDLDMGEFLGIDKVFQGIQGELLNNTSKLTEISKSKDARIKQTVAKVLDKKTSLAEKIRTSFREQGITIFSILATLSMTVSTIVLSITGVFGGGGGALKKWLDRLANALKRLPGKSNEELPAIMGRVVGAILSFLGKAVAFVAEHIWALIVFVAGLIGIWLMQRVKKD